MKMDACPVCGNAFSKDEIEAMTCNKCGFQISEPEEETDGDEDFEGAYEDYGEDLQ